MTRQLTDLGSQAMVGRMSDQPGPERPRLTDLAGNPVAAAFAEAMNDQARASQVASGPLTMWWSLGRPDGGGVHIKVSDESGSPMSISTDAISPRPTSKRYLSPNLT